MNNMENEINKGFVKKKRGAPSKYTETRKGILLFLPTMLAEKYEEMAHKAGCSRTELMNIILFQADFEAAAKLQQSFESMRKAILYHQTQSKELNETLRTLSGDVFGFCEVIPKIEGLDNIIEKYKEKYLRVIHNNPSTISSTRDLFCDKIIFEDFELSMIKKGNHIPKHFKSIVQKAIKQKLLGLEEKNSTKYPQLEESNDIEIL